MSAPPEHGARWARIPSRVFDMHDRGDLSLRQLGMLAWFAFHVNYRTGDVTRRLTTLRDELRWTHTPEQLRLDLHALKELGELDFEMGQGRPGPFTFRLIGDGYAVGGARCRQLPLSNVVPGGFQGADAADLEVPADFQISDPSDLEVSTEPWRSGPAAIARVDSDVAAIVSRALGSATETETDTARATDADPRPADQKTTVGDPIGELVAAIADADHGTETVIRRTFQRLLPEAAFHAAREALLVRRTQPTRLKSEAQYIYGTLRKMVDEGQYATRPRTASA